MATTRYWENHIETEHLDEFADWWLSVYDEDELYVSNRSKLLSALSKLENQVGANNPAAVSSVFRTLQTTAANIEADTLEPITGRIGEFSIGTEEFDSQRAATKEDLEPMYPELSEIRDHFELENIGADPEKLYNRFHSAVSTTAQEDAGKALDIGDIKSFVNEIRAELTSNSVITAYRNEIVDRLEDHLREKTILEDTNLRKNIQFLFAELSERDWPRKCYEEVIKKFCTRDLDSAEERINKLSEKIRDTDPETTVYIPLPDFPSELSGISFGDLLIEERDANEIRFDDRFNPEYERLGNDIEDVEVFAKTTVTGNIPRLVRPRATENLERAFDVLNFGEEYPLETPVKTGISRFYAENHEGDLFLIHRSANVRYIDQNSREYTVDKLDHFDNLSYETGDSKLEEAIKNAMRWHRYAVESNQSSDKFLKFVIALESILVSKQGEAKSSNIAERGIRLLGILGPYQDKTRQFFENIYAVRSKIAHSAEYRLPEVDLDLKKLHKRTTRILSTVEEHLESCDDINEVLEVVDSNHQEIRKNRVANSPVSLGASFAVSANLYQHHPDHSDPIFGSSQFVAVFG